MATTPAKFRIDVDVHTLLKSSDGHKPVPVAPKAFSRGKPQMGLPPALSHDARLAIPVCKVTCVALVSSTRGCGRT
jgi:hypothetical protein